MPFPTDSVILVNEQDEWLGTMEKLAAHREGLLHRAFSVFVLNDKQELLLQQRALNKYHSGGLWSNTCCSHPFPAESTESAAHRRLQEEMGFDTELTPLFNFRYKSDVGNGLVENEFDHIYIGYYSQSLSEPNPTEVMAQQYCSIAEIEKWMKEKPEDFTAWFHLAFPIFINSLPQK
jgi:isopentenyl-diphosphate delta-isomerase